MDAAGWPLISILATRELHADPMMAQTGSLEPQPSEDALSALCSGRRDASPWRFGASPPAIDRLGAACNRLSGCLLLTI